MLMTCYNYKQHKLYIKYIILLKSVQNKEWIGYKKLNKQYRWFLKRYGHIGRTKVKSLGNDQLKLLLGNVATKLSTKSEVPCITDWLIL